MAGKIGIGADRELNAINVILKALDGLEGESIQRVLDYVTGRLSIGRSATVSAPTPATLTFTGYPPTVTTGSGKQPSIRDLKLEKSPSSSNQMAALVAYYLSEVAPPEERKGAINSADLEKYFKQAGFKLPKSLKNALPNASAAGYFDATGGGMYKLNPVGYNLIAHGLPRGGADTGASGHGGKKK